jgi:ribosomal protein L13
MPGAPENPALAHDLLQRLRDGSTPFDERRVALRRIKNEVIGMLPKKEDWVRHGALDVFAGLLRPTPLHEAQQNAF